MISHASDPMWTVINEGGPFHAKGLLEAYIPFLESTGRGWTVAELERRHPDVLIKGNIICTS